MRQYQRQLTATGILALFSQIASGQMTQCNKNACFGAVDLYNKAGCPASFQTTVTQLPITNTITVTTTSTISAWQNSTANATIISEAVTSTTQTVTHLTSTTVTPISTIQTVVIETETIPTTVVETSTTINTITNTLTTTTDIVATADITQTATVYARDSQVKCRGLDSVIEGAVGAVIKAEYSLLCKTPQAFISACACLGVPTSTTTLSGITATATATVTTTTTEIHYATATNLVTKPVTDVIVNTETTTIVETITEPSTTIEIITSSTTVISSLFTTDIVALTATESATAVVSLSSTTTITVAATATLSAGSCSNEGVQWALWSNPYGDATQQAYTSFVPAYFKTKTPLSTGTTSIIGGFNSPGGATMTVYGSSYSFSDLYFVLDHKFYLYATQTGTYTFDVSKVDDLGMLWLGSDAYSGWSRSNDLIDTQDNTQNGIITYSVTAGQYLPVRLMMAQAQGGAALTFTITAPDGTTVLSSGTGYSKNILQFSCDGITAPPFEAWGNES